MSNEFPPSIVFWTAWTSVELARGRWWAPSGSGAGIDEAIALIVDTLDRHPGAKVRYSEERPIVGQGLGHYLIIDEGIPATTGKWASDPGQGYLYMLLITER